MRAFSLLLTLPFILVVLVFALHNRATVALDFWPFEAGLSMPVSLLALALFVLGFAAGSLRGGIAAMAARRQARKAEKEADTLRAELQATKAQPPAACTPAFFAQGRYTPVEAENLTLPSKQKSFFSNPFKRKAP